MTHRDLLCSIRSQSAGILDKAIFLSIIQRNTKSRSFDRLFVWLGRRDSPRSKRKITFVKRPQLTLFVLGQGCQGMNTFIPVRILLNQAKTSPNGLVFAWLGRRDSNPRMHGPKPCALPLGHAPLLLGCKTDRLYLISV